MTTVTFDTLDLVERLKTAGIPPAQAEAQAQDGLVTKQDLVEAKNE